jgi:hypothetical protein
MSRRIIGIALLLLWIAQCSFSFIYFNWERKEHRAAQQTSKTKEIHAIDFEKYTAIDWELEGREFRWNNQLYDVVSITENNGTVHIQCTSDTTEDELVARYAQLTNSAENKDPLQHSLKKYIELEYIYESMAAMYTIDYYSEIIPKTSPLHRKDLALDIASPPPEA